MNHALMLAPWVTAAQAVRVSPQFLVNSAGLAAVPCASPPAPVLAPALAPAPARLLSTQADTEVFVVLQASLSVFAWTVNDEATIARMVSIGVDAIVTDYPERIPHAY